MYDISSLRVKKPSVAFRDVLFYDKSLLTALSTSQSEYLLCQRISFQFACSCPHLSQSERSERQRYRHDMPWRHRVRVSAILPSTVDGGVCVQRYASAALPPGKSPGTSCTCGPQDKSGRSWRREISCAHRDLPVGSRSTVYALPATEIIVFCISNVWKLQWPMCKSFSLMLSGEVSHFQPVYLFLQFVIREKFIYLAGCTMFPYLPAPM